MNMKYMEYKTKFEESGMSLTKFCKENAISRTHFTKFLKECNVPIINKQNESRMNSDIFENIDSNEKAYWLGFLYADGYISNKETKIELALKEEDHEHLIKFAKFLEYTGKIEYKSKTKAYRISFRSKKMKNDLISKGCIPNKSKVLKFPTYEIVPKEHIKSFIRGYIDGDGYIGNDGKYLRMNILGTEDMILGIIKELELREVKIRKANKDGADEIKQVEWKGLYLKKILDDLYKDSDVYLERKYNKYKTL